MSVFLQPSAFTESVFIKYIVHIQRWAVRKQVPLIANPKILRTWCFVRFADLPQMWHIADLHFTDPTFLWFANLKLPQVRNDELVLFTNIAIMFNSNLYLEKTLQRRLLGLFWYRVVQYFVVCGSVICGLIIKIYGFAIADWHNWEIREFAIEE